MKLLKYLCIIIIFLSITTFGQSYDGPLTSSVNSGIVVNTDNFLSMPISKENPENQRINKVLKYNPGPIYYNGAQSVFGDYVYVEDENTNHKSGGVIGTSFELHGFPANGMTNFDPPDNTFAVGPNHVMTSVNMNFSIWDRDGNLLKTIDGVQWFSQIAPAPEVSGDPQVIYDHYEQRWFFLFMGINSEAQQASNLICYSDDENPLGTWYMYRLPTTTWGDYPHVGYDDQGIYITTNNFTYSGSGFLYVQLRIINKSELYSSNADSLSYSDIWNISLPGITQSVFTLQPTISYDPGNDAAYFAWNNGSTANFYALYKLTDPVTNPVLTGVQLPVSTYNPPNDATQLGGNTLIANLSRMTSVPVLRDGKLYAAHAIRNTQFTNYGSLKYFVVDVITNRVDELVEFGGEGYFYLFPSITVDADHNIAITYSRSGDNDYVGAYYSTKLSTDPPGLSSSKVMKSGEGNYNRFGGNSVQRWGDYLAASLDPVNQYNIWLYSEYAADVNQWGTWLTEIRMKPFLSAYANTLTPNLIYGNIEVGIDSTITAILANVGEQNLVITDIPSSVGDFYLDTTFTSSITLSTYDSLSLPFTFSPTVAGDAEESYPVTSNDPNFIGFTLTGHGYTIYPALDRVMYASSGPQNGGDILYLNKDTGEGTNIGPSTYNDLSSLTISPLNNELYGVRSLPSESQILRVNSLGGDAYLLYSLDLGNITSIAFDTSGTLYGARETGQIYSIDLTNGTYSYVSTALINITAITFEPITNNLWATIKGGFGEPKDGVYKIDLPTGDTTTVGETGFNIATNDLAFDENGVLYGIKGRVVDISDLFTIDMNTGEGTIIGPVGLQALTGLAYAETGIVNDVQIDENNNTVPTEFVLSQNYPNPFNPSTSIEFSIPIDSDVTLTIYNLLGQAVTELVNEEINSGNYSAVWNGEDQNGTKVSSGVYLYKMQANGANGKEFQQIRKMVLLK